MILSILKGNYVQTYLLRQGLTLYQSNTLNSLCNPKWPRTHGEILASAARVQHDPACPGQDVNSLTGSE